MSHTILRPARKAAAYKSRIQNQQFFWNVPEPELGFPGKSHDIQLLDSHFFHQADNIVHDIVLALGMQHLVLRYYIAV